MLHIPTARSFLVLNVVALCGCTTNSVCVHVLVDIWALFQFEASTSKIAVNIHINDFLWARASLRDG